MKFGNRIKSVRWLVDYRLRLVFKDGFIGDVDLRPIAEAPRGPTEQPLGDVSFFKQAQCDGVTVVWPNEYDLCPDVLRYWCEIGRVCSDEELNAAFNEFARTPETSGSVLKDQPPN